MSWRLLRKIWLSLAFASAIVPALAQEASKPERAQIGFGSTVRDAEIVQLLENHGVSARAAFMWSSGLSLTHRVHVAGPAGEFLRQARTETVKFLKNSLAANARRLDQFLNEHTEESVAADEQLQREARSLLNIRSQLEGALSAAESGHPICYALEVQGSRANLERLRAATVVTASVDAGATAGQDPHLRVTLMKPEAYKAEFRDPVVETASPRDVYALVTQAASASKQE